MIAPEEFIVIIPAYNEEPRVGQTVAAVKAACRGEVVVVDDGSGDRTFEMARAASATVLRLPFNLGYGAALQTGFRYALRRGFRYAVHMDADGQHDPTYIGTLLDALDVHGVDVAIGSRFVERSGYRMPWTRRLGRLLFAMLTSLLTGKRVTDPTSGFQAFSMRALQLYASNVYPADFPDADVLIMLHRSGLSFVEVPVVMQPNPKDFSMHSGMTSIYYVFKMLLSILVTLMRRDPKKDSNRGGLRS